MATLKGRDLLTLGDLTPEEVRLVLDTASRQKAVWAQTGVKPLEGKSIALIFMKPSMRTRVSFELACVRLGAHPVVLGAGDAFSRNETVYDTTKVLERYVDAIVLRTYEQQQVEEVAEVASIPVVNALTDDFHPCQGLADLLTIREKLGRLEGVRFAYVGDGNNMANTYLLAGALTGMHVTVASPAGFEPSVAVVAWAKDIAATTGAQIEVGDDPDWAATDADVVVTDTWASMGQEAEHDERVAAFRGFTVDSRLLGQARPDAVFLHCLPAHRGEEVTDEVMDGPHSAVFDEAENRLHVQQALLSLVL